MKVKIGVNFPALRGQTAFHMACEKGHLNVVEILMNKSQELGMDLNAQDDYGRTAFHLACLNDHLDVAQFLIKNSLNLKIDLTIQDNDGSTALHLACAKYDSQTAEILLEDHIYDLYGFNNARDFHEHTSFQIACQFDQYEVAKLIVNNSIQLKIDLNSQNQMGK